MASRTLVPPRFVLPTASGLLSRVHEWSTRSFSGLFRTPLIAVSLAISYYLGTLLGLSLKPSQTSMATFWPPSAILLAACLLAPSRMWWAFLLAVLPAHLLAQLQAGATVPNALGWFVANTGGPLMGAICIRFFKKESLFGSVQGVIVFLTFGVLVSALVKSLLDAAVTVPTGLDSDYWMSWTTRLSANMISYLTIVPTIVLFGVNGVSWIEKATLAKWAEAGLLAFSIVFVSVLVFGGQNVAANGIPALIYASLPFLFWASVRFGVGGLSASMLVVALILSWNAMHRRGPLPGVSTGENVLFLHSLIFTMMFPLMLLAAAIAERRRSQESLRDSRAKLIHAQEQERRRVARELHDDIVQQLVLIRIELERLRTDPGDSVKTDLDRVYEQVSNVSDATRDLSHELHPFMLEYLGLAKAMRVLCQNTAARNFLTVSFAENTPSRLAEDISLCLYRVTQEALQNIVKHSHARTVAIELKVSSGRALLQIVDDGGGMTREQQRSGGMGLASMRERVAALDGAFEIASAPEKGTTIVASVPLKAAA